MNVVFTMDVDWASEDVIEYSLQYFAESSVPLSIFMTHESAIVESYQKNYPDLFSLNIHPNFYPGSTHGKTTSDVINHCRSFAPRSSTSRSHGLVFSSNIMLELIKHGFYNDFSLVNPLQEPACPITFRMGGAIFRRFTFNWEDDLFFFYEDGERFYNLDNFKLNTLIMNFHPIHIYLNSVTESDYLAFKAGSSTKNKGQGTEEFLKSVLQKVKSKDATVKSLSQHFQEMISCV